MNQLPISIVFEYKNGELVAKGVDQTRLKIFLSNIKNGSKIKVTYEEGEDGTLGQLKKVYAMIDALSQYSGYTKNEIKKMIKGVLKYCDEDEVTLKSFALYSKEELSSAIQVLEELGEELNFPLS